jgi:hypothetical protein
MKKTMKNQKALELSTRTIKALDAQQLGQVAGGEIHSLFCPTRVICVTMICF